MESCNQTVKRIKIHGILRNPGKELRLLFTKFREALCGILHFKKQIPLIFAEDNANVFRKQIWDCLNIRKISKDTPVGLGETVPATLEKPSTSRIVDADRERARAPLRKPRKRLSPFLEAKKPVPHAHAKHRRKQTSQSHDEAETEPSNAWPACQALGLLW